MNISNKSAGLLIGLGLLTGAVGAVGLQVSAHDGAGNSMTNLVSAIATKFNLNTADVQQVFDEHRDQMELNRGQKFEDRLSQAVTDGKLTQEQSDLIKTKLEEVRVKMDALRGSGNTNRSEEVKTIMDELKQWAEDNNIPSEFMMGPGFGLGKMGPGKMNFQR